MDKVKSINEAFDLCREADRPLLVELTTPLGTFRMKVYPSGRLFRYLEEGDVLHIPGTAENVLVTESKRERPKLQRGYKNSSVGKIEAKDPVWFVGNIHAPKNRYKDLTDEERLPEIFNADELGIEE